MNKPSWSDAPSWANWLAMDLDGSWWWYEKEPFLSVGGELWVDTGPAKGFCVRATNLWSFTDTLEPRPEVIDFADIQAACGGGE